MLGFVYCPCCMWLIACFFSNNISLYIHISSVQGCSRPFVPQFFLWHPLYLSRTVRSKSHLLLGLFWVQIFYIYYLRSHREHLLTQSEFFTWILPVIVFFNSPRLINRGHLLACTSPDFDCKNAKTRWSAGDGGTCWRFFLWSSSLQMGCRSYQIFELFKLLLVFRRTNRYLI